MNKKILIVEDHFVEANDLKLTLGKAGYEVCGIARSVPIALEMIKKEKPGLVLVDIFLKGDLTGIDLARQLKEEDIAFVYLSANSDEKILAQAKTTEPYGFIVKPFREKDLLVTLEIAQYRYEFSRESRYRREKQLMQQLESMHGETAEWKEKMLHMGKLIQQEIPFDYLSVGFDPPLHNYTGISFLRIGFNEYQVIGPQELSIMTGATPADLEKTLAEAGNERMAAIFNNSDFETRSQKPSQDKLFREMFNLRSLLFFPVIHDNGETCSFRFYSRRPDTYNNEHLVLLHRLHPILLRNTQVPPVSATTGRQTDFRTYGSQPLAKTTTTHDYRFDGIIGNSHLLLNVLDQVSQVAPLDTSVLILGESGTGKERIADCIHNLSPRRGKPLVKVNCAALAATLIESELFGHEKGAFTGATDKRIGKFGQANGGTIFLDEIGEMTIDLQVKLLRVLQEKEIEPVGGQASIKIDVRIIAATNKNLEKEVAEGRFRLDLYYRLNVFPILMPALRERMEDLPALSNHFLNVYNRKAGKTITGISEKALKDMMSYSWPGNVRELEHIIERSVLLAKGAIIEEITLRGVFMMSDTTRAESFQLKTIHENERDHIITVLKKCHGRIWGSGGAAQLLNVPPTTLKSKMIKLGIRKEDL